MENLVDVTRGYGYTEGNAWHHSFPPYAIDSLIRLFSKSSRQMLSNDAKGKELLIQKLLELFLHPK
jgi:hypothetical protein